jgi:hypothetical protein
VDRISQKNEPRLDVMKLERKDAHMSETVAGWKSGLPVIPLHWISGAPCA